MNLEILELCDSDLEKSSKKKVSKGERERMVKEILTRKTYFSKIPEKNNLNLAGDPLDYIPNYQYSLEQTLKCIPNRTNKILLRFAWTSLPYFRENHNLLLSNKVTFIRKALNPNGIIVHMHSVQQENCKEIFGYYLVDNPFVQEIRFIKVSYNN